MQSNVPVVEIQEHPEEVCGAEGNGHVCLSFSGVVSILVAKVQDLVVP